MLTPSVICSTSDDSTIMFWDISSGEPIHTLEGHEGFVYDVIALTNGTLASVGKDREIRLWKLWLNVKIMFLGLN